MQPVISIMCALLFMCAVPVSAQDEFVPLFNGTDLDGWVNVNCAPETWVVDDGTLVCSGLPTGMLRTARMYENYVIELEWRHTVEGGNAGLFVHSDPLPAMGSPFPRCCEVQIQDGNNGDIFAMNGATLTPRSPQPKGAMRSLPEKDMVKPAGEWNRYRVESLNGTITLWVNDVQVNQVYQLSPRKGYICLESEGSEVHFRNIRIMELPGSNPPIDDVAAEARGFRSLYNGTDMRGWQMKPGHHGHWKSVNWRLEYDGHSEEQGWSDKHIWTEESFGDYELIVDWRLPEQPHLDRFPVLLPDGTVLTDSTGAEVEVSALVAGDTGILLRGSEKSEVNIWSDPVGSGDIWGYRNDDALPREIRGAATPIQRADNSLGEWNRFHIVMRGSHITITLNGRTVVPETVLPGIPASGPIGIQHHENLMQFANIYIRELNR